MAASAATRSPDRPSMVPTSRSPAGRPQANASTAQVIAAMKDGVDRLRKKWPQLRIIGATVVSALGSSSAAHGFPEQDSKRKTLNDFIRTSGTFDGVIDFDKTTLDPQSGGLKPEFVPDSTTGGPGDKL